MNNRVEGHQGIYKNDQSGIINNRSGSERERYKISKEQAIKNLQSQEDIKEIKQELDELKHLLTQLVRKR